MSASKEPPMNPAAISTRRVPRIPTTTGWGLGLALGAALISGLAIYLNGFAVKQLPDAAVFTTLKNAVAAGILRRRRPRPRPECARAPAGRPPPPARAGPRRRRRREHPVRPVLQRPGDRQRPAAAFIQKTLFVWVAILAVPFLGERLGVGQLVALAVLIVGQALVLPPSGIEWGRGETLILIATLLWAVETILVKRLLGSIASPTVAAARMGIGLVVLVGYLARRREAERRGRPEPGPVGLGARSPGSSSRPTSGRGSPRSGARRPPRSRASSSSGPSSPGCSGPLRRGQRPSRRSSAATS